MPLWTKYDLMKACNASDPTSSFLKNFHDINGISIDERTISIGDLFIALIGDKFDGPAIIFQKDTTTVVPPNCSFTQEDSGNLFINIGIE